MASIDIYKVLEANAQLAREKKELVHIVRLLSKTVRDTAVAAEVHGETMVADAARYRSIPKGFLLQMGKNIESSNRICQQVKQSADRVDASMDKFVGDDENISKAYYDSLVEELKWLKGNGNKPQVNWMYGFYGPDGKIHMTNPMGKPQDPKAADAWEKQRKDIDKFISDQISKFFKIDPKNYGGDIEGEWQDGWDGGDEDEHPRGSD